MATKKSKTITRHKSTAPRCLKIAQGGIQTGSDFAAFMSALMSDIIEQRIDPSVANASCNAGGKLLKVVEMQHRYGEKAAGTTRRVLNLAPLAVDTSATVQ